MVAKKGTFQDKWDEFDDNGIKVLTKFLSDDIKRTDKIQEISNTKVFSNKDFIQLYNIIYNLSILPKKNFQKALYQKYAEATSNYLRENVLSSIHDLSGTILLRKLSKHWDLHINIFVKWLGKCFKYLDQHYVKNNSMDTVGLKGEILFKTQIFMTIKVNVYNAIMEEFEKERDGKVIDDQSLKQVIEMLIKFKQTQNEEEDFYKELEELYVSETSRYYSIAGKDYLKDYT